MNKYNILKNVIDHLMEEAPAGYKKYYPDPGKIIEYGHICVFDFRLAL